ncbi:MAG: hypothetical protein Q8830_03990, partial [Candidatus Phytoplasma australasiaticum]|nr:hypothetical protein [Candidatus Phytoplasma australasiaticum]
ILRPGRFDRRFTINLPSARDRKAILELHAKNKHFSPNVNLSSRIILMEPKLMTKSMRTLCLDKEGVPFP